MCLLVFSKNMNYFIHREQYNQLYKEVSCSFQNIFFEIIGMETFFNIFIIRISLSSTFMSTAKLLFFHKNITPPSNLSQALIYSGLKLTYNLLVITPTLFGTDLY